MQGRQSRKICCVCEAHLKSAQKGLCSLWTVSCGQAVVIRVTSVASLLSPSYRHSCKNFSQQSLFALLLPGSFPALFGASGMETEV